MSSTSQQTLSPISLTASSLGSHLLPTEEVLSLCNSIGLYSDSTKSPHQQNGTTYLTSHRIIYVDEVDPRNKSGYLHLKDVRYTEHFRGFLKSSPKVILGVGDGSAASADGGQSQNRAQVAQLQDEMANVTVAAGESSATQDSTAAGSGSGAVSRWLCPVCGFSNTANDACQLCGVKKDPTASTSAARVAASAVPSRNNGSSATPTPPPPTSGPEIACPTCTFLNHPSMSRCEVCDSPLGAEVIPTVQQEHTTRKRLSVPTQNSLTPSPADSPATRPTTPAALPTQPSTVKLSFRKGGDKAFYDALTSALRRGAWKAKPPSRPGSSPAQATTPIPSAHDIDGRSTPSSSSGPRVVGIEGLLSSYNSKSASDTSQMSDALKDLKALMSKAKDMVELAEGLEARLRKREAEVKSAGDNAAEEDDPTESEAATLIRSSLVKLGLPAPAITKEMAKNEEEYHRDLAKELGYVLLGRQGRGGGLMGHGSVGGGGTAASRDASHTGKGIVGLDEVWCVWNRLRGVALIPPSHLLSSTRYLPNLTTPSIHLRIFPNGLRVLSTPHFNDDVFSKRLLALMRADESESEALESQLPTTAMKAIAFGNGVTPLQIAQREGVSLMLVQQLLSSVEMMGGGGVAAAAATETSAPIVRDEVDGQVRWYRNRFEELAV